MTFSCFKEPDSSDNIHSFCTNNFGVSFTMMDKIDVNGNNTHPVYQFLKSKQKLLGFQSKSCFLVVT